MPDKTDAVMDLAKRRGLLWPSFDVYGGAAGFYDYGPLGAVMKKRFEDLWRRIFVTTESTPMAEIFCPRVTPEEVLLASGHVAEFTDMVVKCAKGHPSRADHLVAASGFTGNAGILSAAELDAAVLALKAKCPVCGSNTFTAAARQNLMNQTEIGPGSGRVGYLRPETAQGIFTDFPLLFRHFRERLPFGVVQLGGSNRNEISPRQGMLRLREFSMMEAEVFYDPAAKRHPRFAEVAGRTATFVPQGDEKDRVMTFGEAVRTGMVDNEALAYWIARTQEFLVAAGIDPARLHFRQHLKNEMAHYAVDCWDAEFYSDRYGWVECVGIADRGLYDLTQHARHTGADAAHPATGAPQRRLNPDFLRFVKTQEVPVTFTTQDYVPTKKLYPALKQQAKRAAWLMAMQSPYVNQAAKHGVTATEWVWREDEWLLTEKVVQTEKPAAPLNLGDGTATVEVPADCYEIVTLEVTVQGRKTIPCVIEPSFGVDRILYALWEHAHEAGEKNGEPYTRLRLSPRVAPIQAAVLPLTNKDNLPQLAHDVEWRLRNAGILTDFDDSGSIGRRYARQDEVGTPYCITVDNDSLVDQAVTVRERDSGAQERIPIEGLLASLQQKLA